VCDTSKHLTALCTNDTKLDQQVRATNTPVSNYSIIYQGAKNMASDSEPIKFFWKPPRGPSSSHISGNKMFSTVILVQKTLANCNKASIKKSSAHHINCSPPNRPTPSPLKLQDDHFCQFLNLFIPYIMTTHCEIAYVIILVASLW